MGLQLVQVAFHHAARTGLDMPRRGCSSTWLPRPTTTGTQRRSGRAATFTLAPTWPSRWESRMCPSAALERLRRLTNTIAGRRAIPGSSARSSRLRRLVQSAA